MKQYNQIKTCQQTANQMQQLHSYSMARFTPLKPLINNAANIKSRPITRMPSVSNIVRKYSKDQIHLNREQLTKTPQIIIQTLENESSTYSTSRRMSLYKSELQHKSATKQKKSSLKYQILPNSAKDKSHKKLKKPSENHPEIQHEKNRNSKTKPKKITTHPHPCTQIGSIFQQDLQNLHPTNPHSHLRSYNSPLCTPVREKLVINISLPSHQKQYKGSGEVKMTKSPLSSRENSCYRDTFYSDRETMTHYDQQAKFVLLPSKGYREHIKILNMQKLRPIDRSAVFTPRQCNQLLILKGVYKQYMDFRIGLNYVDNSDALSDASTEADLVSPFPNLSSETYAMIQDRVEHLMHQRRQERLQREREAEERRKKQEEFRQSVRATIQRNEELLKKTQSTIQNLQGTIQGCRATQEKFKLFKDTFQRAMDTALEKFRLAYLGESVEEGREKYGKPVVGNCVQVANRLLQAKSVCLIIGSGLSQESGVSLSSGETVLVGGREMAFSEVFNKEYYDQNSLEIIQILQNYRKTLSNAGPNTGHFAIAELYQLFHQLNIKTSILTQVTDNFDRTALGPIDDLYELHGNLSLSRCENSCTPTTWPSPPPTEEISSVPQCINCGGPARFHVLLFGEPYTEELFRANTAVQVAEESDCYIVVGSDLKLALPQRIVQKGIREGKFVVEVNVNPVLEYGVTVFQGLGREVLSELVEEVKRVAGV